MYHLNRPFTSLKLGPIYTKDLGFPTNYWKEFNIQVELIRYTQAEVKIIG
jgi:hypothetical protein